MKNQKSSGIPGIVCLIGAIALFLFLRYFFPALSTVFLVIAGVALLLVILLVVLIIVFSRKKPE